MQFLRQSTAVKVVIGPVVAVVDGIAPVTNLSLSTADEAEIIKHDASSVTSISGGTLTAISSADGYYNLTMTTAYTDTVGMLTVLINDDNLCYPISARFMVLEEAVYDEIYKSAATAIATAVWDKATASHTTAGTMGAKQNRSDRTGR